MAIFDESTLGRHLSKILSDKLGKFVEWTIPAVKDTVGPYEPDAFASFDLRRKKIVDACRNELLKYNDEQIHVLVTGSLDDPDEIEKAWKSFKGNEIYDLNKKEPPWFAAGFGHPDFEANFEFWSQCPHFSYHEALMLSLGLEPKRLKEEELDEMMALQKRGYKLWPPVEYMLGRREQIGRQFPSFEPGGRVEADSLFDWFKLVELEVHPEFKSKYVAKASPVQDSSQLVTQTKPHKREVDTISQLFTAMAIEYYGYDPKGPRSPVPKEIVELAAAMGIEITDDTVRKYLRVGASFIPEDWERS